MYPAQEKWILAISPFVILFLVLLSITNPFLVLLSVGLLLLIIISLLKKYDLFRTVSVLVLVLMACLNIGGTLGLALLTGVILLYSFGFLVSKDYRKKTKTTRLLLFFILWLVYGLTQFLIVNQTDRAMSHLLSLAFGICIVLFMTRIVDSKSKIELFYKIWGIGLICTIIVAWWEIITGNHLPKSGAITYNIYKAATAFHFNPNDYSFYLILSLPVIFYWIKQKFIYKVLGLCMLYSSFFIMFINQSRLALILFFVGVLVFLFELFKNKKKKQVFLFLTTAVVCMLLNVDLISQSLEQITTLRGFDNSTNVRIDLMDAAIQIFINHPLGVGAGNLELYMPVVGYNAHNFWVEILVNYGMLIFIGLIGFFALSLFSFMKNGNKETRDVIKPILWMAILFLPGCVMSSTIFQLPMVWVLFGVMVCSKNLIKNSKSINSKSESTTT